MFDFFKYAMPLSMGVAAILTADSTLGLIIGILGAVTAVSTAIKMFKDGKILFALDLLVAAGLFGATVVIHFGG